MTQRQAASIARRVLACVIDAVIPAVVIGGIAAAMISAGTGHTRLVVAAVAAAWLLVHSALQAGKGSLGMRIVGIRLIGAHDLLPLGFARALARNAVLLVLCAVVIGFFTPLFDRSARRGWHDRIVAASMVQQNRRMPVVPPVLQEEKRAEEWLAGVSVDARPAEPIRDVPVSRVSRYLTTEPPERTGEVIESVPGITDDRVRAEHARVRTARRARGEQLSSLAPVQAARSERSRAADEPPAITRPPAPPLTITQRSGRSTRPAIVVSPPARDLRTTPAATHDAPLSDPPRLPVVSLSGPSAAEAVTVQLLQNASAFVTIMWDDGTLCEVERETVFGRNPIGQDDDGLAVVFDDSLSLSKSHFRVQRNGADIGLVDLHSTNGVRIRREGVTTAATPGEFTPLQTGDLLEIGSRRARVEVTS
ncbi:RDD family protein [Microbacterium sp. ZW T5_56]|uniref:RDD family protein n=1 Tax=Microbacterium sp. ZW T5_56 TaxID=3378081 RepID=UPI00385233F1